MSELLWIIGATFLISLISFVGVFTLSLKKEFLMKILLILVAFAAGALLSVSIFDLLPEALGTSSGAIYVIIGILIFFMIEHFVGWHHSHHEHDIDPSNTHHKKPIVYTNLLAEVVHNFIDGTLIAASFLVSIPLGIAVTLAVALHEIPQEIGDFAILIYGGLKPKKALFYNFIAAIFAVIGGILSFYLIGIVTNFTPILLGIAAGGFLYMALTDLLPEIHREINWKKSIVQFIFLLIGILIIYILI